MNHTPKYHTVYPYEIRSGMASGCYVLMLAEPKQVRAVPMLIGPAEAQAIMIAQEHQSTLRPMTHRLMLDTMETFGLALNQVTIDRFEEGIFYATLSVGDGFNEKAIDSRASDAVTLALLSERPILIADSVLEETAVPMDALASINGGNNGVDEPTLEDLERQLARYEEDEDYEKAAEVLKEIERRKGVESSD